jgi:2-polyprenyl-3-methyl-5-hydroxy-6-metoxy-1,4-benzoquinol methylase
MQPELTTSVPLTPLTYARRAEPIELPELMDGPLPYAVIRDYLGDLAKVNRFTRGYKPTLAFLDRIAGTCNECGTSCVAEHRNSTRPLRILDVGSGGGDTLRAIAHWAAARNLPVELTGVDLNPLSTRAAREFTTEDPLDPFAPVASGINFVTADVFSYSPESQPDIVLSALFTHHLSTPEIVRFLSWMEQHARLGWFINDLHRSRNAAFFFRFLPILLGWHRFIGHDGPVSLRRAFVPEDWQRMLAQANISAATIEAHSMNRLCVARVR